MGRVHLGKLLKFGTLLQSPAEAPMPLLPDPEYKPPYIFGRPHTQSLFPYVFRNVDFNIQRYGRERVSLSDGDFLDLDWVNKGSNKLLILSHGKSGCSYSPYILGAVKAITDHGWDALAWNMRGQSGEPNNLLRWYTGADSNDLDAVVKQALSKNRYNEIALFGVSLGGNVTLKYLGEQGDKLPQQITKAITFSVPCDFTSTVEELGKAKNFIFMNHFLLHYRRMLKQKAQQFPGKIDLSGYWKIRTMAQFDERYTAPFHGYKNAQEFWDIASSKNYLSGIRRPTLLVNAQDDPLLAPPSFPIEEAKKNPALFLEMPKNGGHAGFLEFNAKGYYWSDKRMLRFING